MAQQLIELVEQFCTYQRKQRGRTEGGVKTYRWNLEQFLAFVKTREGRLARVADLTTPTIQAWLDEMAARRPGRQHPALPALHAVELLWLARQAWAPRGESDCPDRPAAARGGDARRGRSRDHGRPDRGGQAARPAAGPGDLPPAALHRDAARLGGEPAGCVISTRAGACAASG